MTFNLKNFSIIFTAICGITLINMLNMYDGIDLQYGLYFFTFNFFFIFNSEGINHFIVILIISTLFFLILNYHKITYIGNAGIYLTSYLIFFITCKNYNNFNLSSDLIVILFLIPFLDLVRLFSIRIYRNKNPFLGDKNHIHHRMLKKYGFNKTVLTIFLLTFIPALITYYGLFYYNLLIVLVFLTYITLIGLTKNKS